MAVTMVRICDRHQNIILTPQTEETHTYPSLASGCQHEIHGAKLIEKWVEIIRNK